jgi:hypothetical protein
MFVATPTHSNYLDPYISQTIRPCVDDLEGQFQTRLQVTSQILDLRIQIFYFYSILNVIFEL